MKIVKGIHVPKFASGVVSLEKMGVPLDAAVRDLPHIFITDVESCIQAQGTEKTAKKGKRKPYTVGKEHNNTWHQVRDRRTYTYTYSR
jgi:hypothetical protein